ncbi:NADPH-dependent F420 reductase [Propionicicella superfundia]|uniref:NADPH-dependent F420 reductase n=1 Tax=Propionicicella superfundia TaxID=348582 RepID=UPI000424932E|nr:NAD(P)-binding domain-containing protein [Propionicicella superfundia]
MRIAVLGTGAVGSGWAERLRELGHDVVMGTRTPGAAGEAVRRLSHAEAVAGASIVVNALNGAASLDVLERLAEPLTGTVLMDIANPLDFSHGSPALFVAGDDSLAERLQRALPATRVVKAANTMNVSLQVHPERNPGTVFVAGDDTAAKEAVAGLLREVGHDDILDLGDLTAARGLEMFLPLWLSIMGALGTAEFQVRVQRPRAGG